VGGGKQPSRVTAIGGEEEERKIPIYRKRKGCPSSWVTVAGKGRKEGRSYHTTGRGRGENSLVLNRAEKRR